MSVPDRRGGSAPVAGGRRTPATKSPGRIHYVDTERIGFEHVPEELVEEMTGAGVLAGELWAAAADAGVAKRRADGSHYQHIEAWWSSQWRYVQVDARRELELGGDGKLRPVGAWSATGSVWVFAVEATPERSVWRYQPGSEPTSGRKPPRPRARDPLEALPGPVAGPVLGGDSYAWVQFGRGWASETIVASKVADGRILLLRANREATSQRGLGLVDWVVETVDAPSAPPVSFSVGSGRDQPVANPRREVAQPVAAHPEGRSWDQYHRRVCVACGTKTRWRDANGRALCETCSPVD